MKNGEELVDTPEHIDETMGRINGRSASLYATTGSNMVSTYLECQIS
jgi:hypothetical protein